MGKRLSNNQKEEAFEYLSKINPEFVPFAMKVMAEEKPFPKYLFGTHFKSTHPLLWWKSVTVHESDWPDKCTFVKLCDQLFTAVASTAGLERQFSTYGLIQSKLQNKLATEKAEKLVFLFKYLRNREDLKKQHDLNWV